MAPTEHVRSAKKPRYDITTYYTITQNIPLIIFGSTLLLKLMQTFPFIITLGAALLGFVAGEMAVTDLAIHDWFEAHLHGLDYAVSISCALAVVAVGTYLSRRSAQAKAQEAGEAS